jgi:hypothetical protein
LIALIDEAAVIERILRHLRLPTEVPAPRHRSGRGDFFLDTSAAAAIVGPGRGGICGGADAV